MQEASEGELQDLVQPRISDSSGYALRYSDVDFIGISRADLDRTAARVTPLGMDEEQYAFLVSGLTLALGHDGLTTCDVRLQGSSVRVFAGAHKEVPWKRDEIYDEFVSRRGRIPAPIELDRICRALSEHWPDSSDRPLNPIFDLLHRVGIDRERSDYDLQLSSDEIDERARGELSTLGVRYSDHRVKHPNYNFIVKRLFEAVCPFLTLWAAHASDVLGRNIVIAAFPSSGPPDCSASIGGLSAHFRDGDWLVVRESQ